MNEANKAKSSLEVLFFLCDVCQSEKETVEQSPLLAIYCICYHIIIIVCILQT